MSYATLTYDVADTGVATIRLNRPDRMNAMTAEMRRELTDAIAIGGQSARALVVTGNGPGFCAGQDLGDVRSFDDLDLENTLSEEYGPLIRQLVDCPVPTIAAVNGAAAGAGANFALGADICIAAESATFLQAFARIGLIPDVGGTYWLPRKVGMARAMALSLLAEPITAEQARDWGLIWEVVPDDDLETHVQKMAARLASGPTAAYRMIKQALLASPANDLDTQFALEAQLQGEAGRSHDFREGVMAFLEKRKPTYRGA